MFNLGLPEMLILGAAALLLFGPRRLPELAKGLGKGLRDFKKAVSGEFDEPRQEATPITVEPPRQITSAPSLKKVSAGKKRTVAARATKKPRRKKSA